MQAKKTLYQLLQAPRTAGADIIKASYEARVRELGDAATPEANSQRTLLRRLSTSCRIPRGVSNTRQSCARTRGARCLGPARKRHASAQRMPARATRRHPPP